MQDLMDMLSELEGHKPVENVEPCERCGALPRLGSVKLCRDCAIELGWSRRVDD